MIWKVIHIDEDDYGCEERMPGEPLTVLITIESEDGRQVRFSVAEQWLCQQSIEEGDEWPEDPDKRDKEMLSSIKQSEWMDNYYDAIDEMEND